MAQSTGNKSFADRVQWDTRLKPWLKTLVIAAIAFLVALYIVAPQMAARQANHLPTSYLSMPTGAVELTTMDGSSTLLPLRVANTSANRSAGFKGVGEDAIENQFLMYVLTRPTTSRASYSVEGIRAPVEYAAIDPEGNVVSMHVASLGATRLSIPEPHRWLLAAEGGTMERFGIGVGATVDPASIQTF